MICLAVTLIANPGSEDRAADCFQKLSEQSRTEPGCLMYQFHRSPEDPRKFFVYEQYVDEAALQAHNDSSHYAHYVKGQFPSLVESAELVKYVPL